MHINTLNSTTQHNYVFTTVYKTCESSPISQGMDTLTGNVVLDIYCHNDFKHSHLLQALGREIFIFHFTMCKYRYNKIMDKIAKCKS